METSAFYTKLQSAKFFAHGLSSVNMENISSDSLFDNKRSYVFLILACLAVYANSLGGDFVFDDTAQIVGNTYIHSWQNLIHAFTTDVWAFERGTDSTAIPPPYYRPVFTIYLTVGYQLFGLWAARLASFESRYSYGRDRSGLQVVFET